MLWGNQSFARPFQRGGRSNNTNGLGWFGANPQLQGAVNPQLNGMVNPQLNGWNNTRNWQNQGAIRQQIPQQQGQFKGQNPQHQGQFIGQPTQHQGQFIGQLPQQQGQFIGQPPQQQGQFIGQLPQQQGQFIGQLPQQQGQFIGQPPQQQGQFIGQPPQQQGQFIGQRQAPFSQAQNRQIMPPNPIPQMTPQQQPPALPAPAAQIQQPQAPPSIQPPGPVQNAAQAPDMGNNTLLDKLQNVGTYMGYPEYTLPGGSSGGFGDPVGSLSDLTEKASGNSIFNGIKELIQNERNGSDFYRNISEIPAPESAKASLSSIAKRSDARSRRLMDLYRETAGERFSPESRSVKRDIGLSEGIRLAIKEESKTLKSCAEIAESTPDLSLKEKLNEIILEKLCQINELNHLISE